MTSTKAVTYPSSLLSASNIYFYLKDSNRYGVSLCIQFECGKIGTRITPNMDTFHAVLTFCL